MLNSSRLKNIIQTSMRAPGTRAEGTFLAPRCPIASGATRAALTADNNLQPKSLMKFCSAFPLFVLVLILPLTGCWKRSSAQSARELKQAFTDGNEAAPATVNRTFPLKAQVDQVASAIDKKDYVGAVTGLEELRARPG